MNRFQSPMEPFPGLEPFVNWIQLPKNQLKLYLYQAGKSDASPMLLIHGLGDDADTWRHQILPLSEKFRVIALDLPGFGRSDKPRVAYSPLFFQGVVLELLEVLGIPQITLAGHSLGAITSHLFSLDYPERVERLVLVDGSLVVNDQKLDFQTMLFLIPGLGEWLYGRLRKDPLAAFDTLQPYYANLSSMPQKEQDFLYQRVNQRVWSDGQKRAFLSAFRNMAKWLPGQQKGLPTKFAKSTIPTLVVWGEQDRINSVNNASALKGLQPAVELVVVPDAGHNLQQEKPQEVLNIFNSFMKTK